MKTGHIRQRIVPHLWFDKEAEEAADFYVSLFENSTFNSKIILPDTPSGDTAMVDFDLAGMNFAAISAGPYFKLNPSVSLMVTCKDKDEVNRLYEALIQGGKELMPLAEYDFSSWYVWLEDRYGLSWQIAVGDGTPSPKIQPCLLFSGDAVGKAEDFMKEYVDVFENSAVGFVQNYAEGDSEVKEAKVMYGELMLYGFPLVIMDNGMGDDYTFNEAFSLMIYCNTQEEIDYYTEKLSHVPEAEQCGWVKDKYGFSWQIVPANMNELLFSGTEEEIARITRAFLQMKKFDITELLRAKAGENLRDPGDTER
ncbi:MAG TPA: hypothetical protein DHM90_10005 [Clostridiaceae bacterium]|nr:hypothetical protein [Clostridiaceae bacterium]